MRTRSSCPHVIDAAIAATGDLTAAPSRCGAARRPGAASRAIRRHAPHRARHLAGSKGGVEIWALMSEIVAGAAGTGFAVLRARPRRRGGARLPTAVNWPPDPALGRADRRARHAQLCSIWAFRRRAEIGGAVKNVLAIACGTAAARPGGQCAPPSSRGARRDGPLARAKGAGDADGSPARRPDADLRRCNRATIRWLRPRRGQGARRDTRSRRSIAEGVSRQRDRRSARLGVDMPIVAAVDAILHHDADIDGSIASLLARPFRDE